MARIWNNHEQMVSALAKSGEEILRELTPEKVNLWHAATGICTEAGEFLDAVKKHVVYNQEFNWINGVEEMGDIEFYLEQARQSLRVARAYILTENMTKLTKRYGEKYTDSGAKERADKKDGE